ncbi:oxidoreductase [Nakamurella sp. YIM 132087]|uniref:Oxidoreductase n=1 Tax=Nakamurella alba TaxID=2665158 RepID=A0A7K1FHA3_9ACTN|nr:oxidoreductase [Nakamurella alba]MTD13507.1 oxidoreductase [Nakamurella alba]
MGMFGLGKKRSERKETRERLDSWVQERRGVEVFVEPKTAVTGVSMVLVAHDGEFTRRLVDTPAKARDFARDHGLPIYDATVVGYPQRMRDYSRRTTLLARRAEQERLDGR